jgi:hypothetical protein
MGNDLFEAKPRKKALKKFELTDIELKTSWEGLNRVIRQLSGSRSWDWKRGAVLVRDKLENELKKRGIIK